MASPIPARMIAPLKNRVIRADQVFVRLFTLLALDIDILIEWARAAYDYSASGAVGLISLLPGSGIAVESLTEARVAGDAFLESAEVLSVILGKLSSQIEALRLSQDKRRKKGIWLPGKFRKRSKNSNPMRIRIPHR